MPTRVNVRAVIWVGDRVVVHRIKRRGKLHVTLPGGRVNERESVVDALVREVREELELEVEIGDLLLAAEVVSGARRQDIELVFESRIIGDIDPATLDLVDPRDGGADVLPPILDHLTDGQSPGRAIGARWLGNVYVPRKQP